MKKLLRPTLLPALFLTLLAAPWRSIAAEQQAEQQVAPAIVISIAPIDEQFSDVAYVAQAMQAPLEVQLALGFGKAMIPQGIDTTKPMGGYLTIDAQENIQQAFFIPVTDLDKVLKALEKFLPDTEELENGVIKITAANGRSSFLKQQGGWVFIAERKEILADLPQDPEALLDKLPKTYNIAAEIQIGNVPDELKSILLAAMTSGFEDTRDQIKERNPESAAFVDKYGPAMMDAVEQFVTQADSLMYGIAVDATKKSAYLDISVTGQPGSDLAKELSESSIKSRFGGFASPKAAASLTLASKLAEADVQVLGDLVTGLREEALEDADNQFEKEVMGTVFDVLERTIEEGEIDTGAALFTGDGPGTITFAIGAGVADGQALDKVLRKLVKRAPEDAPEVTLDADMHGDVVFHTATIEIPERNQEARDAFGETTEVTVGFGQHSIYVAVGNDTVATLKQAIDASKEIPGDSTPPLQFTIAARPVLEAAAAISGDDNLQALADSLKNVQGKDKLSVTFSEIKRGARFRLEAEEGIILVVGQLIQKSIQEQGPGGRAPVLPPGALSH